MKKYFWRIAICVVPLLIAAVIVGNAISNYRAGRGGFKLGVDLSGGTILIYEVDPEKLAQGQAFTLAQAQELATRLKSRIDPGDLYNITIRVVSTTRFEIILPTGGKHQIEAQNTIRRRLIQEIEKEYPVRGYRVPVGRPVELVASINAQHPDVPIEKLEKLINEEYTAKAEKKSDAEKQKLWASLLALVEKEYPAERYEAGTGRDGELLKQVQEQYPTRQFSAPVGKIDELAQQIHEARQEKSVEDLKAYITKEYKPKDDDKEEDKKKAWEEMLGKVDERYGKVDQKHIMDVLNPSRKAGAPGRKGQRGLAMNQEMVQERKDLIAQQGSLEFRAIANRSTDRDAIRDVERYFEEAKTDPKKQNELQQWAEEGKPPQVPDPTRRYSINLGGETFQVRYAWVELGQVFRREHGLANPRDAKGNLIPPPPVAAKDKENDADFKKKKDAWEKEYGKAWTEAIQSRFCGLWTTAAKARASGTLMEFFGQRSEFDFSGWGGKRGGSSGDHDVTLLYSREVKNPRIADKDRDKEVEYWVLTRIDPNHEITGAMVSNASPGMTDSVDFSIKERYADLFQEFTKANIGHIMIIVLDGYLESAATIQSAISSRGQITMGGATQDKINFTVKVLRSGALPATLKPEPVSESTMGPTLGATTIYCFVSVLGAFAAVLLFMLVYYRFAGVVACVALLANLLLTMAFMLAVDATFTLPGLAGLVLMLGMAVDANVLIYERLREERDRGASLTQALRNGYDHALPTIIDTHLSSIFTAVVLYVVGNDQLKGFGISLTAGLIISLFTSLYMTRVMFDVWESQGWLKQLSMYRLLSNPRIDFMSIRYQMFALTTILTIAGATLFIYRLDRGGLNIDFVGGVAYTGELKEPRDLDELRAKLGSREVGLYDPTIEQLFISDPGYTQGTKSKLFTVLVPIDPTLPEEERRPEKYVKFVENKINSTLGDEGAGWLKTTHIALQKPIVEPGAREAYLSFTEPADDGKGEKQTERLTFASRAQVDQLLTRELEKQGLETEAKQLTVVGLGKDNDGRYQWMKIIFPKPVADTAKLIAALEATKQAFTKPLPERLENFDSQLAKDTQVRALYAILASWGAILLYLWFRFGNWTFGLAAVLCLIHDLFFTLGAIALCHYIFNYFYPLAWALRLSDFKIDLPTVAALLTLVGYSVNDTIVVFDRIREVRGKNPTLTPEMINTSINQTLSRTILTSFVTWLVVVVLYIWGGEGVHLFAFVMVVGVIIGTYSSIYIASPLLLYLGEGHSATGTASRQPTQPVETGA